MNWFWGFFQCLGGKCILEKWICDGDKDCEGGEDEVSCTKCNGNAFQCKSGNVTCLPLADVCDGYGDCEDGSDEHDDCAANYNELHGRFPNHRHKSIDVTGSMEYYSRGASMFCDNSKELHCRNAWRDFGAGVTCLPIDKVFW